MSFRKILKEIVDTVGGGVGAVLMGYDGVAIDEYCMGNPSLDPQLVSIEYSTLLKEIKKTAEVLDSGTVAEVSINTDGHRMVFRNISEEFFVALVITAGGNFGKARYLLRRDAPKFIQELA